MSLRRHFVPWSLAALLIGGLIGWQIGAEPVAESTAEFTDELAAASPVGDVIVIQLDTAVHPVASEFLLEAIDEANLTGARALVVELNTPGGLLTSTRTMTAAMLESKVPVVVFVSPEGAQAGSAGFFLLMAADIAAMTPGSNAGAAHPVAGQGQDIEGNLGEKVEQDAAAFIRSLAQRNGRNVELAEKAVIESRSYSASEALEGGLIDVVAEDVADLLARISGREFARDGRTLVIETAGAPVRRKEWSPFQRVRSILAQPDIAYLLLSLGGLALYIEITNPGAIFPGVLGAIFMILGFYSMSILPVNYAGLALMLLAAILFILEIKVQSFGLLTVGGVVCLVLGSTMLFSSADPVLRVSYPLIAGISLLVLVAVVFLARMAYRAMNNSVATGKEGLIGERGSARSALDPSGHPSGKVAVRGEVWNAMSDQPLDEGDEIEVTAVDGMTLTVKKINSQEV